MSPENKPEIPPEKKPEIIPENKPEKKPEASSEKKSETSSPSSHSTMLSRRKQREIVMKSLYMKEIRNDEIPLEELIVCSLESISLNKRYKNRESLHYATHLLHTTIANEGYIISIIKKVLRNEEKSLKDLLLIDKSIMLMAIAEMSYYDTDHKIIINEAIELSKQYSSEHSFKFINGVLDACHQSLVKKIE